MIDFFSLNYFLKAFLSCALSWSPCFVFIVVAIFPFFLISFIFSILSWGRVLILFWYQHRKLVASFDNIQLDFLSWNKKLYKQFRFPKSHISYNTFPKVIPVIDEVRLSWCVWECLPTGWRYGWTDCWLHSTHYVCIWYTCFCIFNNTFK